LISSKSQEPSVSFSGAPIRGKKALTLHSDISIGHDIDFSTSQQEPPTILQQGMSHRSMDKNGVIHIRPTRAIEMMEMYCLLIFDFT